MFENWDIDTVVLSSGGLRGLLHFGAYKVLKKEGILSHVRHYIASSVGSFVAAFMACDIDIEETVDYMLKTNFCDWNSELQTSNGLVAGKEVYNFLQHFLGDRKLDEVEGIRFSFTTVNLTKGDCEVIDTQTHGKMKLVDAVMLASSIPILMPLRNYEGSLYCDGAPVNPFPVNLATDPTKTLGLYIEHQNNEDIPSNFTGILTILDKLWGAILKDYRKLRNYNGFDVINLACPIKIYNPLSCSPEEKVWIFHCGEKIASIYLEQKRERLQMASNDADSASSLQENTKE
tara:strand:- start:394 stop:1260 length:867 start_codon:yes stop_codon:yes gene_type:complete